MRVCILSEASYPIARGGLSEWAHMLIKASPEVTFDIFVISPTDDAKWESVYEKLPNIDKVIVRPLTRTKLVKRNGKVPTKVSAAVFKFLKDAEEGNPVDFESIIRSARPRDITGFNKWWLTSKNYWDFITNSYNKHYINGPFGEYFWVMNGLNLILVDSLQFINEIPKADIYHSLTSGVGGFAGSMAKIVYNKPLVVTLQGLYLVEKRHDLERQKLTEWYRSQHIRFTESMIRTSYKYADVIVPPSRFHMNIESQKEADPQKVMVINNGIETERFIPMPRIGDSRLKIGCFARVVPIKGITTLINAAKIICAKFPVDFLVIGEIQDEKYYQECLKMVDDLGLVDRIKFIGHANVMDWYKQVDIFTLSSFSEGVPYALLEAMSCGLPCVCTAVGGIPEILVDGLGLLVPSGEPVLLAQAFSKLIEDKELRIKMGQRAMKVVREKYTIAEEAKNVQNLYTSLIK